jgi:hypothetical protein
VPEEGTAVGEGRTPIIIPGPDVVVDPATLSVASVSESTLSPIGLQTVELCLNADYPKAGMCDLVDGDPPFNVSIKPVELELTQLTVNEAPRKLNVVKCDEATGCLEVKYGGAYSGTYEWEIVSAAHGNIDTSAHPLKVVVEVIDI